MAESTYGGGRVVKVSLLSVGDTIRDPKRNNRILIVEQTGSQVFARGYDISDEKYHVFLQADQEVILVTNAATETSKEL